MWNMNYNVLCEDYDKGLLDRLLFIRWIEDDLDDFLDPKINKYWIDPFKLKDMDKAVERIISALKNKEKIMIFWDYDVDWITSSFVIYTFVTKYLNYNNISITFPDRIKDWYGLKKNHIDDIKEKWVDLIITVDNWITSIEEAKYAKEVWIDLIITDHHSPLDIVPDTIVINPKVSPDYNFKDLAWVWVAFKLVSALMQKSKFDTKKRNEIFNYLVPIVAIWTIADVVPLLDENRAFVKKGLNIINKEKYKLPESLKWILDYLNLTEIDTFHVWFVIWPRINAGWRIASPFQSLKTLLSTWEQQIQHLEVLDEINKNRKSMQEDFIKIAEQQIDNTKNILIVSSEDFHEWVVGIVSGRITEKYNKPSVVIKINREENKAVASLRWPEYFNIIDLLKEHENLLERFGGHKQAWWLTVNIDKIDEMKLAFESYCETRISDENLIKTLKVDTMICENEREDDVLSKINILAPFGEWNSEPLFLKKDIQIINVETVWKKGNWHLKIHGKFWDKEIKYLFRGKGKELENIDKTKKIDIIWKIKKDDFSWGYFFNWTYFSQ